MEPARAAPESEARMRALHRASLSLYADLSLDSTLHRIVDAARELAEATYAAIGIVDGHGGLETFIPSGLSPEEQTRIPHLPTGRGLIGEMIRSGHSIRVPDMALHPASVGFPPGHPPMRSFLGVPIAAYGRPIGQIYLTNKVRANTFTEEDQHLIELLAAHAAAAIENARLFQAVQDREAELRQRNEELELVNTLASASSTNFDVDRVLGSILDRLLSLIEAHAGEIFLREEGGNAFALAVHRGLADTVDTTRYRSGEGFIGWVVESGQPCWTDHLGTDPRLARPALAQAGFRTMACIPLAAPGGILGVMTLAFLGSRPVLEREIRLLTAIGGGVGMVLENARLLRQARRLAVLEERERIGMDLHDGIIQAIYAVGLTLDSARLLSKPRDRRGSDAALDRAIAGLNAIIRDIRTYILDLQPSRIPMNDLGEALRRLLGEFKANSLMEADLLLEPEVAEGLPAPMRAAAFHIAQEAVANIAKHSGARRAWVSVRRVDSEVMLQIIDNGRGFDSPGGSGVLGHGLSNMSARAHSAGGELEVASNPGEGTTITVRFPILPATDPPPEATPAVAA